MTLPVRVLTLTAAAFWLVASPVSHAEDKLLIQQDYSLMSDSDRTKFDDILCITDIDVIAEAGAYDADVLAQARQADVNQFLSLGTQAELDANIVYETADYKADLANGTFTIDQYVDDLEGECLGGSPNS